MRTRRCGPARWSRPSSIIRSEDAVVVPTVAVQRSQSGNFVFVVKDGVAKVQPVKVDRTFAGHRR